MLLWSQMFTYLFMQFIVAYEVAVLEMSLPLSVFNHLHDTGELLLVGQLLLQPQPETLGRCAIRDSLRSHILLIFSAAPFFNSLPEPLQHQFIFSK